MQGVRAEERAPETGAWLDEGPVRATMGNAPSLLAAIAQTEPNEIDFVPPRLSLDLQVPGLGQ
jgi:hypothetical protein